jgi:hypothetical protein
MICRRDGVVSSPPRRPTARKGSLSPDRASPAVATYRIGKLLPCCDDYKDRLRNRLRRSQRAARPLTGPPCKLAGSPVSGVLLPMSAQTPACRARQSSPITRVVFIFSVWPFVPDARKRSGLPAGASSGVEFALDRREGQLDFGGERTERRCRGGRRKRQTLPSTRRDHQKKAPATNAPMGVGPSPNPSSVARLDTNPTTRPLHRLCRAAAGRIRSQPVRSARKCPL